MPMFLLIHMLEKKRVHGVDIDFCKRNDKVRRQPALILDGKDRWKFPFDIFKNRKREHSFERVQLFSYKEAVLGKLEAMKGRSLCRVERDRDSRDDDEHGEQIIAEEHERHGSCDRDDTKSPIPIRALRIVFVFTPFPLKDGNLRHALMIPTNSVRAYAIYAPAV